MARSGALAECVDRFESELRALANELVRRIFEVELELARAAAASNAVARHVTPASSASNTATAPSARAPSSTRWTRDAVVGELGQWLISSKTLDMSFLRRHGPPGLVAAAKRFFGRFDAALNAANLAIAPQMQGRREVAATRQAWPSTRELARKQRERRAAE